MNAETIERLKKDEASLADAPWCEMWLSMGIRHLSRNCNLDCPNDDPYHDCGCPGRYDGSALARIRNELPALLAAAEERDAARAEAERLRAELSAAAERERGLREASASVVALAVRDGFMDAPTVSGELSSALYALRDAIVDPVIDAKIAALADAKGGGA